MICSCEWGKMDSCMTILEVFDMCNFEINDDNFITEYAQAYFYGYPNNTNICINRKTCCWVESRIMRLKDSDTPWTVESVYDILAWKIGKICHRQCYDQDPRDRHLVYANDWREDYHAIYGIRVELDYFANSVANAANSELRHVAREDPQNCLNTLRQYSDGIDRLYSVYLVTLLFFLSGGEWPIYDSYAAKALFWYARQQDGIDREYRSLPNKYSQEYSNMINGESSIYRTYIDLLNDFYGDRWKADRNVDRSLWVLGHSEEVRNYH